MAGVVNPPHSAARRWASTAACAAASAPDDNDKWAIHPDQVPIANQIYAPTDDEIAIAERNVAAYRAAEANGRGAVGVNGVLVDAAHVKMAEEILARAAWIAADH
jgi:citrate lyase beta subunit